MIWDENIVQGIKRSQIQTKLPQIYSPIVHRRSNISMAAFPQATVIIRGLRATRRLRKRICFRREIRKNGERLDLRTVCEELDLLEEKAKAFKKQRKKEKEKGDSKTTQSR